MATVTIYHNPRCSKSRQTLKLLEDRGEEVEIIRYLEDPPDAATLGKLLKKLSMKPRELMRRGEKVYRELGLKDKDLSDDELIDIMVANPVLIERPIVVKGRKAVLGRPPENVLDIL